MTSRSSLVTSRKPSLRNAVIFLIVTASSAALPIHLPTLQAERGSGSEIPGILAAREKLEKLGGGRFLEGPAWDRRNDRLIFSDTHGDELKTWTSRTGVDSLRKPANNPNGNAFDRRGNLVTCEHGARALSLTESSGRRVLAEKYQGRRLNSPNDLIIGRDQRIWFTDPDYGIAPADKEQPTNRVYRYDPRSDAMEAMADDFNKPNGITLSPDNSRLYVGDSETREIIAFDIKRNGDLTNRRILCRVDSRNFGPDGIDCDARGNLYAGSGDGVQIFSPDGKLLGRILTPGPATNTCFGGADGRTLFITTPTALYRIRLLVRGPGFAQ